MKAFQYLLFVSDKIWWIMVHQHPPQFLSAGESYDNLSKLEVKYLLKFLINEFHHLQVGLVSDNSLPQSVDGVKDCWDESDEMSCDFVSIPYSYRKIEK